MIAPTSEKNSTLTNRAKAALSSVLSVMAVIAYSLYICCTPNQITDVWWQLRLGDEIRLNHQIPSHDTYSWSSFHRPIVLHEWGSCLAYAEAFRHMGGWIGVWILLAAVTITTILLMYLLISRRLSGGPLAALLLTILAGHLCGTCFTPRPQVFTYLFLTISFGIFLRLRKSKSKLAGLLLLLFIVQVVWANLHAAAPIFVLICVCYAFGDSIQAVVTQHRLSLDALTVPLLCALTTILGMAVNPSGIGIYHIVVDTVGNKTMPSMINEWASVDFHTSYGKVIEAYVLFVGIMLAASKTKREVGDIVALGVLVLSALYATRNVPILAICGTIIIAPYCPSAFAAIKERFYRSGSILNQSMEFGLVASTTISFIFIIALFSELSSDGLTGRAGSWNSMAENIFMISAEPEDLCSFIETEHFPQTYKMYNDYDNGAFLIWRLREFPVFMSSETFSYFGPVLDAYVKMEQLPFNWRTVIAPYHPDFILTDTDDRQCHLFLNASDWALVYADGSPADASGQPANLIFVKKSVASLALIDRCRRDCPELKSNVFEGYASAQ